MKHLIAFLQRHILFLYCIYNWTCTASPTYTYIYEISQCKGADPFKCISSYTFLQWLCNSCKWLMIHMHIQLSFKCIKIFKIVVCVFIPLHNFLENTFCLNSYHSTYFIFNSVWMLITWIFPKTVSIKH